MTDRLDSKRHTAEPVLRARGLTKAFAGTTVVHEVDIDLYQGEVVALVGENGAGKSTLKNMLCGLIAPDAGTIEVAGSPVSQFRAADLGIAAVHQEFSLFGSLSIAENICINELPGSPLLVRWREARQLASQYLETLGAQLDLDAPVDSLSIGEQQLVEIAKALRQATRLLVLDEPTTSLTEPERARLFAVIRRLKDQDLGLVFVSHFIDEVYEIADRIVVLRDGHVVGQQAVADLPRRELESLMVGRPVSERQVETGEPQDEVILRVEGLSSPPGLVDVSLQLHKGEILGLAGLMGAGRTELLEAIYGLRPARGRVWVDGKLVPRRTPTALKRRGVAFVPEDRRHHGLFLNRPIRENLSAADIKRFVKRLVPGFGFAGELKMAEQVTRPLHVVHPGFESAVADLSGGNQQKVVLSRWLALEPRVFMLDEATRGVDIGAKEEIHVLIGRLASQGTAVLLVSSDMEELLQLAHRILVLRKGQIAAELRRPEFDPRVIIERAASSISELEAQHA